LDTKKRIFPGIQKKGFSFLKNGPVSTSKWKSVCCAEDGKNGKMIFYTGWDRDRTGVIIKF